MECGPLLEPRIIINRLTIRDSKLSNSRESRSTAESRLSPDARPEVVLANSAAAASAAGPLRLARIGQHEAGCGIARNLE